MVHFRNIFKTCQYWQGIVILILFITAGILIGLSGKGETLNWNFLIPGLIIGVIGLFGCISLFRHYINFNCRYARMKWLKN